MSERLLQQDEIIRELKRYRYDHTMRVPLKTFAEHVGLHKNTMHKYIEGAMGISAPTRVKLSKAILDIREGRLKFVRRERVWRVEGQAVEAI